MNFGEALQALKEGYKVKRSIWGGYWFMSNDVKLGFFKDGQYHQEATFGQLIIARLKDNEGFAPAQPYQADLLADDWTIVE